MSPSQFQRSHHLIDRKNRILYCYIAKNACSTVKYHFLLKKLQALGEHLNSDELNARIHIIAKDHAIDSDDPGSYADCYRFCIVRDPRARIASAFLDKFVQSKAMPNYARALIEGAGKSAEEWTFADFLDALADSDISSLNEHWMPQYLHPIATFSYDFVPFESLSNHEPLLARFGDLSANVRRHSLRYADDREDACRIPVGELKATFLESGAVPGWRTLFADETETAFLKVFGPDLELHRQASSPKMERPAPWPLPGLEKPVGAQKVKTTAPRKDAPVRKRRRDDPLISVVVPVYNVERYVRDCMESLVRQKDEKFEVIVVDDGSPDESISIVEEYAPRLQRLRVITQSNKGLGGARNTGIAEAEGEFVAFVDSDDTIAPTYVSALRRAQADQGACVVTGNFQLVSETLDFLKLTHEPAVPELDPPAAPHEKVLGALWRSVACARLYRKSLLADADLRFPERIPHEDLFFTYKTLRAAERVGFCEDYAYSWRQRTGSLGKSLTAAHVDVLPLLRRDTIEYLTRVGAGEREFVFAARRNLSLIAWFRQKARRADRETRRAFYEMVREATPKIREDLRLYRKFPFADAHIEERVTAALVDSEKRAEREAAASVASIGPVAVSPVDQSQGSPDGHDLGFFPLRAYHLRECVPVVEDLNRRGVSSVIVESDAYRKGNDEVRMAAKGLGVDLMPFDDFIRRETSIRAAVFLNDWDPLMRIIARECERLGVQTIGWVEGVNDYHDVDTGRQRYAYLRSRHVITPGPFDTKYFVDGEQRIHAGEVVRIKTLWKERRARGPRTGDPTALINSNFSYGVLEERRDEWVQSAVRACLAAGFTPVLSRHPFDLGKSCAEFQTGESFFEAVKKCDVAIQRFGSGILEALAIGVPVIYYNPHGERIDKFISPNGAFLIARGEAELSEALGERRYFWSEESAFSFLRLHTGLARETHSGGGLVGDIIETILKEAGPRSSALAESLLGTSALRSRKAMTDEAKRIGPFFGPRKEDAKSDDARSLISIIMPLYNVERYVEACMQSIAAQDDDNFEVIVINDGSTDKSLEIVEAQAERLKNVRILSQENRGLGGARNAGVNASAGSFVVFVDSDDVIAPDMISKLRRKQLEGDFDIVSGGIARMGEKGQPLDQPAPVDYPNLNPPLDDYQRTLGVLASSVSCARLIRKSLFSERGIVFPERTPHEDLCVTYKLMRGASHAWIDKPVYRWRQRAQSLSKTLTQRHIDAWGEIRRDTLAYLKSVSASEREFALAARRNLVMLENFARKAESAKGEVLKRFEEALAAYRADAREDLRTFNHSDIRSIYLAPTVVDRIKGRPSSPDASQALAAGQGRFVTTALAYANRISSGLWRRRAKLLPVAAALAVLVGVAALPQFSAQRPWLLGAAAFLTAMASVTYLALRVFQYVRALSAEIGALRKTLDQETARLEAANRASLTDARAEISGAMAKSESLLRAAISNAAIAARSGDDALRRELRTEASRLEGVLRKLEDGLRAETGKLEDVARNLQSLGHDAAAIKEAAKSANQQLRDSIRQIAERRREDAASWETRLRAVRSYSVSLDMMSALLALRPLWLGGSGVARLHEGGEIEHGHALLMAVLIDEELRTPGALKGKTIVEIGATREPHAQQKSTEKLAVFSAATGMKMITVDMDPANIERIQEILPFINPAAAAFAQKGEEFLAKHEGAIDYVYLDAFDFDHENHSERRRERYREILDTDINDEMCWRMHFECAEAIIAKMRRGGIVVFDDTWAEEGEFAGKGKTAVPLLLHSGFEIVARTPSAVALRRADPAPRS